MKEADIKINSDVVQVLQLVMFMFIFSHDISVLVEYNSIHYQFNKSAVTEAFVLLHCNKPANEY